MLWNQCTTKNEKSYSLYLRHFRKIQTHSLYINYCPSFPLCGVFPVFISGYNGHKLGKEGLPFTQSLSFVSLPQIQWHALVNIDNITKQTGMIVVSAYWWFPMVVLCKSCPWPLDMSVGNWLRSQIQSC